MPFLPRQITDNITEHVNTFNMSHKKYKVTGLKEMDDGDEIKDPIIKIRELNNNVKFGKLIVIIDYFNDSKQKEKTISRPYELSADPFDEDAIWAEILALPQHSGAIEQ